MGTPQRRAPKKEAESLHRVSLTVSVKWWSKAGTSVRWYWEDEDSGTWGSTKPFWEMTRKGFEVHTPEECLEALKGSSVTVTEALRLARQQDSA